MFEVLVYVYENYWRAEVCPDAPQLERRLSAAGFEAGEIHDALNWLDGLQIAVAGVAEPQSAEAPASPGAMRIYSQSEQDRLGAAGLGFISFLESCGVLSPPLREIVLDRALAVPDAPVLLDDLKLIVLMVYWGIGREPDALILDELCDDAEGRLAH